MFYKPITILCLLCCLLLNLQACATKDLVVTSATESQRAIDHQRGIDFLQNEDDHSTYSQNFGNAVARYYGYALSSYGSGYGSAKINNPSSINQNYYASNNKEFSRLDKQKGANRQLHQEEVEWLNDKQKIAKFKDYIQKATSKRYTDDEAKKILAKGGISLSDESFNEAYKESLSDDELADIGLAKEYIKQSDFYNKDLDGTNDFNPTASQYKERYMYLNGFINNQNFYIDNLKVDKPFLDDIAGFGKGFISGGWNFISNSVEGAYDTAKGAYNKIATEGIYNLAVEGKHKLASIDPIEVAKGAVNYMSDTFDSAQIGFYKGNLDMVLADYEAVTKRDTEGVTTVFTGGAGIVKGSAAIGKAALKQGLKEIPKKEIVKPALSKEQVKKVFVDSKSANSDLATLLENTNADILVTSKGLAIDVKWLKNILAGQGTSIDVGKLTGLKDASIAKIVSRLPKDWKVMLQNDGNGIKFVDKNGVDRVRIHGPSSSKHIPENSNARQGWVLRISEKKNDTYIYYDDAGNIKGAKTNETHIPIKGNLNAEK